MAMKVLCCRIRSIDLATGRAPSTVSREPLRNGYQTNAEQCVMGRPRIAGGYDACVAANKRKRRESWPSRKFYHEEGLWAEVRTMLEPSCSPSQIAAKLRQHHPGLPELKDCHKTIYTAIRARRRSAP